ncbi:uncharacterized protein LOC119368458 [Triticum dicoccoides]|uniref:uncharacterized protein LOC119368458 n=1 Tax=Triticum dicoccoides TaxID=85692 RepID=UPI0018901D4C|nr:uncharacterized protein LOC119368458 [Triticum dicoccoides]
MLPAPPPLPPPCFPHAALLPRSPPSSADFVSICGERERAGAEGAYWSTGEPELGLDKVGFSKRGSGHGGCDRQSRAKPAPTHNHRLVLPRGCRRPELPPVHESCPGEAAIASFFLQNQWKGQHFGIAGQ